MRALMLVLLAACTVNGKSLIGGPATTSTTPAASTSSSSSPSSSSDADREREAQAQWHAEQGQSNLDKANFLRAEFEALVGLTVDKAKAQAKQRGHTGEIEVREEREFVASCKDGAVCSATDQLGGQSGMSNDDKLVLNVNKKLAIAPPPD